MNIQHANQANSFSQHNNNHEASTKEREQLLARIDQYEVRIAQYDTEANFLREQLRRAQG